MWWPITGMIEPPSHEAAQRVAPARVVSGPEIDTGRFEFVPHACDIAALNRHAAAGGALDITALSIFAWAAVRDRYDLTSFGSSFGEGYGPKVVGREPGGVEAIRSAGAKIAVPGFQTTAFALLRLMSGDASLKDRCVEVPFDRILEAVASGEGGVTHGLLIHQSQLTYAREGLHLVADTGRWWREHTVGETDPEGLPLPLGGNAVSRTLDARFGEGATREVVDLLASSLRHALAERDRSAAYAQRFAPELTREQTDEYLRMYVSPLTLDAGEAGERAIRRLVRESSGAGLTRSDGPIHLLRPSSPVRVG